LAEQKLVPRREGRRVAPSVAAGGKSESRRRSGEAVDTRGAAHVRARALSLSSNNACSHAFLSWHGRSPSLFAERETASHLRTLPFDPPARSAPPPLPPVSAIGRQVPSFACSFLSPCCADSRRAGGPCRGSGGGPVDHGEGGVLLLRGARGASASEGASFGKGRANTKRECRYLLLVFGPPNKVPAELSPVQPSAELSVHEFGVVRFHCVLFFCSTSSSRQTKISRCLRRRLIRRDQASLAGMDRWTHRWGICCTYGRSRRTVGDAGDVEDRSGEKPPNRERGGGGAISSAVGRVCGVQHGSNDSRAVGGQHQFL